MQNKINYLPTGNRGALVDISYLTLPETAKTDIYGKYYLQLKLADYNITSAKHVELFLKQYVVVYSLSIIYIVPMMLLLQRRLTKYNIVTITLLYEPTDRIIKIIDSTIFVIIDQ